MLEEIESDVLYVPGSILIVEFAGSAIDTVRAREIEQGCIFLQVAVSTPLLET